VPITVADLVAVPSLGLRLHTRGAPVDRRISWVHVSELADPAPFLEGGELLLTTGLGLSGAEPVERYVRRLVEAEVVALGFGTGVGRDAVPAELVAVADAEGLAVVEVPRQTPFIALSRTVSATLAADEYAAVARAAAAQQELTRAALAPGAPATVLERLTRQLDGWALLLDAMGTALEAVPRSAGRRASELQPELDRLRATRAPASAATPSRGPFVIEPRRRLSTTPPVTSARR
jgi:purine catabolism regulator